MSTASAASSGARLACRSASPRRLNASSKPLHYLSMVPAHYYVMFPCSSCADPAGRQRRRPAAIGTLSHGSFVVRIQLVLKHYEKTQGFFATTLPFSHTYSGVPYIRAVLRASLAARRNARPTPTEKCSGFFARVLAFMALSPVTAAADQSSRKPPMNPPSVAGYFGSSPSLA